MKKLSLRTATEEDAPMIADLIYETEDNPDHIWGQGTKDVILNRIQWLIISKTSRYSYLNIRVAELDGKICGAIVLLNSDKITTLDLATSLMLIKVIKGFKGKIRFIKDLLSSEKLKEGGPKELYIANLATTKEVRGLGIGKELMKLAEKIAREEGYRGCSLLAKDAKVMKFYEKLNYILEGEEVFFSQCLYRMVKTMS